ncbi:Uncharacterized protein YKR070W [Linum perenne]
MRFHRALTWKLSGVNYWAPLLLNCPPSRCFSRLQSNHLQQLPRSSFGIAFDIDGVILGGRDPIGGSPRALRRLYGDSAVQIDVAYYVLIAGCLKVPFVFLTNGGGIPENRRASELSKLLGVKILPSQILQGHSPFRNLLKRYEHQLIIATGKGEPDVVMSEYGFKNVLSLDDYASLFENIDPVSQYKRWASKEVMDSSGPSRSIVQRCDIHSESVKAVFVVSDPVDWGRDIQAAFPSKRLGMGAFRIALESVFNRIHHSPLEYVSFGKPNPFVFKNAEVVLNQFQPDDQYDGFKECQEPPAFPLETLYMIGDNPCVDVKGANQTGRPWFSILTRTGVFRGEHNHTEFPADLVVETVEDAVDYILRKEVTS